MAGLNQKFVVIIICYVANRMTGVVLREPVLTTADVYNGVTITFYQALKNRIEQLLLGGNKRTAFF